VERNLQNRLDAAREARRQRAPGAPGDGPAASGPEPFPSAGEPTVDDAPDDGRVIDLRTLRSMREATLRARSPQPGDVGGGGGSERTAEAWLGTAEHPQSWNSSPMASMTLLLQRQAAMRGEPVATTNPAQERCPTCGGSVRIDMYDLVASVAHMTCLDCGYLYTARSPNA
jgi:hypothetical protein